MFNVWYDLVEVVVCVDLVDVSIVGVLFVDGVVVFVFCNDVGLLLL